MRNLIFGRTYIDADAQSFIVAAGLTNQTQINAIDTLVKGLKANNIWGKMKAIYPFIGGTANSHKFNLKDSRDLDAAFRLQFFGVITHSAGGIQNATNLKDNYGQTFFVPATHLSPTSNHISIYTPTENAVYGGDNFSFPKEFGVRSQGNTTAFRLGVKRFDNTASMSFGRNDTVSNIELVDSTPNAIGFTLGTYLGTTGKIFKNTQVIATTSVIPNQLTSVASMRLCSDIDLPSTRIISFASVGDGLTDQEALVLNDLVNSYQTELGRNVVAQDADAQAFLSKAGISDTTQVNAINKLVVDLKSANIWGKMKAIYPFIGGTANSHKFNLKDPRDLDSAFRLQFFGGITHDANGVLPNGTNGYANTFLPINFRGDALLHNSFYSRSQTSKVNKVEIGAWTSFGGQMIVNQIEDISYIQNAGSIAAAGYNNSNLSVGYFISNRASNNSIKSYVNGVEKSNSTGTVSITFTSTNTITIGALRTGTSSVSNYSDRQCAFASIGDGLTDSEALAFYNIVQTYQTTLNRAVI